MEKLNPNNQPKVKIEKTPQENEDSLNAQEQESGKRENLTLEIDGQKIEAVKYYFEYPEQIQKETGILGYERIKIPNEFLKTIDVNSLILDLSNGEYPTKCFNHAFAVYANQEGQKDIYYDEFKKSKFFVQKIYSIDSRKRLGADAFNHKGISGQTSHEELIDKDTNIASNYNHRERSEYLTGTKDLKQDNKSIFTELNFNTSDFWRDKQGKINFGFSMNDTFLQEYLEKSLQRLKDIKQGSYHSNLPHVRHDHFERLNGVTAIIWNLVFFDKRIQELLFNTSEKEKQQADINTIREIVDSVFFEIELKTSFPISDFFSKADHYKGPMNKLSKHLDVKYDENNGFDYFKACFVSRTIAFREGQKLNDAAIYNETHIPVFINNDNLPQLSWGHAKYAHYFNDKSFNFFKFKHADHLPVKEEKNPSES